MEKVSAGVCQAAEKVVLVFFCAILVLFMYEAGSRLVTGGTPAWVYETPRALMLYVVFIACAPLIRSGGHIAIEILPTRLKGRALAINKFFIHLTLLAVVSLITYYGYKLTLIYYETGLVYPTEWRLAKWWMTFLPLPIGMLLATVVTVQVLVSDLRSIFRRKPGTEVSR